MSKRRLMRYNYDFRDEDWVRRARTYYEGDHDLGAYYSTIHWLVDFHCPEEYRDAMHTFDDKNLERLVNAAINKVEVVNGPRELGPLIWAATSDYIFVLLDLSGLVDLPQFIFCPWWLDTLPRGIATMMIEVYRAARIDLDQILKDKFGIEPGQAPPLPVL